MEKLTKAEKAYRKFLKEDWRPTSREFYEELGVSESYGRLIKRTVKQLAADDGHVWGYHPELNHLHLAPRGNINDSKAIIDFAARGAARSLGGLRDQVRGAAGSKCVTIVSAKRVQETITRAGKDIDDTVSSLKWKS